MLNISSRRKREKFVFLVGVGAMSFFTILILLGMFVLSKSRLTALENQHEAEIAVLKDEIDTFKDRQVEAYVLTEDIERSQALDPSNLILIQVDKDAVPKNYITELQVLENQLAKMDLKKGTILTTNILMDDRTGDYTKEHELDMIHLMSNMEKGEVVDIRIMFATGQDYTILSEKELNNIDYESGTIWINLDPVERMQLNSAVVDAYTIQGSKIYTVKYVEPFYQKAEVPTYPMNEYVQKLIATDRKASELINLETLSKERKQLEEDLKAVRDNATYVDQRFRFEDSNKPDMKFIEQQKTSNKTQNDDTGGINVDLESQEKNSGF